MAIRPRLYQVIAQRKNGGQRVTLQALADACDIHYTTLWAWANGRVNSTNHDMLNVLCRELDCAPGDLLAYVPEPAAVAADGHDGHESEPEAVPAA